MWRLARVGSGRVLSPSGSHSYELTTIPFPSLSPPSPPSPSSSCSSLPPFQQSLPPSSLPIPSSHPLPSAPPPLNLLPSLSLVWAPILRYSTSLVDSYQIHTYVWNLGLYRYHSHSLNQEFWQYQLALLERYMLPTSPARDNAASFTTTALIDLGRHRRIASGRQQPSGRLITYLPYYVPSFLLTGLLICRHCCCRSVAAVGFAILAIALVTAIRHRPYSHRRPSPLTPSTSLCSTAAIHRISLPDRCCVACPLGVTAALPPWPRRPLSLGLALASPPAS